MRVNPNYVLTEYVLNENDCSKLLIFINSKNLQLRTIRKLIACENFQHYSNGLLLLLFFCGHLESKKGLDLGRIALGLEGKEKE